MKVQFWGTSTMATFQTQGFPSGTGRVKQYRVEYSLDCLTFQPILDDFGNNKVFIIITILHRDANLFVKLQLKVTFVNKMDSEQLNVIF